MTLAPLLAGLAAVAGVLAAWDALAAIEQAAPARAAARLMRPLRLAGRAGREPTAPERRRLVALSAAVLFAGGWLVAGPVAGLCAAAAGPAAVTRLLALRRRRWRRRLADGVPALARALADALAAGHSIRGGVQELVRAGALPEPVAGEVRAAAGRLALGARTDAVLDDLRVRAADPAWDTLVAAVLLQRDAGGDLAGLLRTVAEAQERGRRAEVQARGVTAQARATARLVAGLPFAGLALGELASPGAVPGLMADPRSRGPAVAALALGAVALAVVGRLGRVGET